MPQPGQSSRQFIAHRREADGAEDYIAHVRKDGDEWVLHSLSDHLREVARRAGQSSSISGVADWARLAGIWHDLGKYSQAFQSMIRRESGYDENAHIEGGPRNHSTAGAIYALKRLGPPGRILAYLIAGHHAGLPDWYGDQNSSAALTTRLTQTEHFDALPLAEIPSDILEPPPPTIPRIPGGVEGVHFWMRMLFSCLVDADFLDTEAFMAPDKGEGRQQVVGVAELLKRFDAYMGRRFTNASLSRVNRVRADVLRQCRDKATLPPGLFSLTVPTGGGKTLASMAFALNHAKVHGKRRVIYAIPYTSIIEQTADIYRDIFGDSVIEHHSSLDPDRETAKSRLATENWDAPVIVTTNVQLFESLYASKPSRCRKLHNISDSVIVLDEAQTLPPELLQPCLDALNLLVRYYGVTVVLCTATQPALTNVASFGRQLRGLEDVREIIDAPQAMFDALKRVEVELPTDFHARDDWDAIASQVGAGDTVLTIVNTRSDCRELWQRLQRMEGGAIHLSASMCGAHRAQCIADIRQRLKDRMPVRVVSTQLIEAGVDVDFPVVYRALAGIDSIAQAAGRCNREGAPAPGRVMVFVPPKSAPPGQLRRAEQTTVSLMAGTTLDPLAPSTFEKYFQHFYLSEPNWDKHDMHSLLVRDASRMEIQFRTAAEKFRYVDDADSRPILVWWDDSRGLIGKLKKEGPKRWLMRKLQRYAVNLPRRVLDRLVETGEVREVWPGIFAQNVDTLYHPHLGVVIDNIEPLVI